MADDYFCKKRMIPCFRILFLLYALTVITGNNPVIGNNYRLADRDAIVNSGSNPAFVTIATRVENWNILSENSASQFQNPVLIDEAPTISSFLPTTICSGGTVVITGTNLNGTTAVSFGGQAVTSFTIDSPTQITVIAGNGTSGNVTVSTPSGSASLAGIVVNASVGGTATAKNNPICYNTSAIITLSNYIGSIQWQKYNKSSSIWEDIAGTTANLTQSNLLETSSFQAIVTNESCSASYSNIVNIEVIQKPVAGSITADFQKICYGSQTTLFLSGQTGTVQWQKSSNGTAWNSASSSNVNDPITTFTTPSLTSKTYYRAVSINSCSTKISNEISIDIDPPSAGGSISGSATYCTGSITTTTLTLSGYTGTITKWQSAANGDFSTGVSDISNTSTTCTTASNLSATTYYRAVVTSGTCSSANSSTASITINAVSVGGAISGSNTVCSGTNSTNLSLSGHTGTILRWESSTDNWTTSSVNINNTMTNLTASNLTTSTKYRAVVQSGVCTETTSTDAAITVNADPVAGTAPSNYVICQGATASITLSGSSGFIQWQQSADGSTGWSDITAATASTFAPETPLAGTYHFRAKVFNGVCIPVYTTVDVVVQSTSVGGSIYGTINIAYGTATDLILQDYFGNVQRWERKLSSGSWEIIANNSISLTEIPTNIGSWHFRAQVANGSCEAEYSNEFHMTVSPKELTVSSAVVATKVYDQNAGAIVSGAELLGVETGDAGKVTLGNSTVGTFAQSNAGSGIAVSTTMTLIGASMGNYFLTQPAGLRGDISAKTLTITANNISKVYGLNYTFVATNPGDFKVEGLISPDSVLGITLSSPGALTVAPVSGSPYDIIPDAATGTGLNNYQITYLTGKLTVSKALLVIMADDKSKTYGAADPLLTYGYYGWVNGVEPIATTPDILTSLLTNSPVGTYEGAIAVSGGFAENYTFSYIPADFTVTVATQHITFDDMADEVYSDGLILNLQATASSGLAVSFSVVSGPAEISSGNKLNITGAGSVIIAVAQQGDLNWTMATTVNKTLTIHQADQKITFDHLADLHFGDSPVTITATGGLSGNPILFSSSDPSIVTCTGSNGSSLNPVKAGTCIIYANQAGNSNYNEASISHSFEVVKSNQNLTFNPLDAKTFGDASFIPAASASSGLPVSFTSSNTSVATISNSNLTATGAGTTIITAAQAGNDNYSAAPSVDQILVVNKAQLTVTATAQSKTYGAANPTLSFSYSGFKNDEDASVLNVLPVTTTTVSTTSPAGVYSGSDAIIVSGGSDDNYSFSYLPADFTVTKAIQTITFADLADMHYGDSPIILTATSGTSGNPIVFSSSDPSLATCTGANGASLTPIKPGTCFIYANQSGSSSYNATTQIAQTITILAIAPKLTTDAVSDIAGETATVKGNIIDNGGSAITSGGVCWSSSPSPTTLNYKATNETTSGSYSCAITGLSAGTIYFVRAFATNSAGTSYGNQVSLVTSKLGAFPDIGKTYGDPPFVLDDPNSISNGSFSYSSNNTNVASISGNTVNVNGAGTATISVQQAASGAYAEAFTSVDLVVIKTNQLLSLNSLPEGVIALKDIAGTIQVSAFSNSGLPVTISLGTGSPGSINTYNQLSNINEAGHVVINAFQAGNINYNEASISHSFEVVKSNQNLTFHPLDAEIFGDASFNPAASASSGLPVSFTSSDAAVATIVGNTVTIIGAGTTTITAAQAGNDNYSAAISVLQKLTVSKRELTVTVDSKTKSYGDVIPILTYQFSGWKSGENSSVLQALPVTSTAINKESKAGLYKGAITVSGGSAINYKFNYIAGDITILKAMLTISADAKTMVFGTNVPMLTCQYAGWQNGQGESDLSMRPSAVTSISKLSDAGVYANAITLSGAVDEDYDFTYFPAALTVTKADQTITFKQLPATTFGDTLQVLSATSTSGLIVTFSSSKSNVGTVSGNIFTTTGTGTTIITASQSGNANYNAANSIDQTITIGKAIQTISFINLPTKDSGEASFIVTASGGASGNPVIFSSSDPAVAICTGANGSTITILNAGSCNISANQLGNDSFFDAYQQSQLLTIYPVKPSLTTTDVYDISISSATSGGNIIANGGGIITETGICWSTDQNPDTKDNRTNEGTGNGRFTSEITSLNPGITYFVRAYATNSAGTSYGNQISFIPFQLTSLPAIQKTYGDAAFILIDPESPSIGSFSYSSNNTNVASISGNTVNINGAGTAIITVRQAASGAYAEAFTSIGLSITKANQILTLNPLPEGVIALNDIAGTIQVSASSNSGLPVTISLGTGSPGSINTYNQLSNINEAGHVAINVFQAGNINYNEASISHSFEVVKSNQNLTFHPLDAKTFGDASFNPGASASSGLPVSFTSSNEAIATVNGSTIVLNGTGTCLITATQEGNGSYNKAPDIKQILQVKKAMIQVTADNKTKKYGTANPTLTYSYSGWQYGQDEATLTAKPNITTNITNASPPGLYTGAINLAGAAAGNYDFTYVSANMIVTKTSQTINFNALPDKNYGDSPFNLTAFANSSLGVTFSSSDPSVITVLGSTLTVKGVGYSTITATQSGDDNYESAPLVSRDQMVYAATLTIVADPKTKIYGSPNPPLSYSCYGWRNSEDESVFITRPKIATNITNTSTVGVYNNAVMVSGAACNNYLINYEPARFTITPKTVTPQILANNKNFDGTRGATICNKSLIGVLSSDDVNLIVTATEFESAQPGKGKLVTATGLKLTGVSAGNYLLTSTTAVVYAEIYALPKPTIAGPSEACKNSTGYVYTTEKSMSNYQWNVSYGGVITSGDGTNSIIVSWNYSGDQKVSAKYTNNNGAEGASEKQILVHPQPQPIITSSGLSVTGSPGIRYETESGMTDYSWNVPSAGTITNGAGSNSIAVTWNDGGLYTIKVSYANAKGCKSDPAILYVGITSAPEKPQTPGIITSIKGTADVCSGSREVLFTAAPSDHATEYIWTLPERATIASGEGTANIKVNFPDNAISGMLMVHGRNSGGDGPAASYSINISNLPAPAGNVTGASSVCQGASGVNYSVPEIQYAADYNWSLPNGASIVSGAGTNSITVDYTMNATSGDIAVYGTNLCGRSISSKDLAVTINTIPVAPVITVNGSSILSNVPQGNQWYFSPDAISPGTQLSGSTGQVCEPTRRGWYWTTTILNGCISDPSDRKYHLVLQEKHIYNVFPVPNNGEFTISIASAEVHRFDVSIYNPIGQKIYEIANLSVYGEYRFPVNLKPIKSGTYFIVFKTGEDQEVRRMTIYQF